MSRSELNFTEICRCCKRTESGMTSIFGGNAHSTYPPVNEMLKGIASLNVQENDGLPLFVCTLCLNNIQKAFTFILQIIQIDEELHQILLARRKLTDTQPASLEKEIKSEPAYLATFLDNEDLDEPMQNTDVVVEYDNPIIPEIEGTNTLTKHSYDKVYVKAEPCTATAILTSTANDNESLLTVHKLENMENRGDVKEDYQVQVQEDDKDGNSVDSSDDEYTPYGKWKKVSKSSGHGVERPPKGKSKCSPKVKRISKAQQSQSNVDEDEPNLLTCYACNKTFEGRDAFEAHWQEFHANEHVLKCTRCSLTYSRASELKKHMREQHTQLFECDYCPKPKFFTSLQAKLQHAKKHKKDHLPLQKKFFCTECDQGFVANLHYIIHMRRHTGEKPFKCNYCDKSFPCGADVKRHERCHTGEKKHMCSVCCRRFDSASNLTVHMRSHTGEKPYKCQYCNRAFSQRSNLKTHIRCHTGEVVSVVPHGL